MAAIGVLLALILAQYAAETVRIAPQQVWNLCVIALGAGLAGSRLLLVAANWSELKKHPRWWLEISTVHHPLVAAFGVLTAALAAVAYARVRHMPLRSTADALAAPVVSALALGQVGSLMAGSGYGIGSTAPWAIIYTHPLAARWSGAPLGVPVHPVQAYAALAFVLLAVVLFICLPVRRQQGDVAALALLVAGIAVYVTEFWRDPEGRGSYLGGALDGPQFPAIALVLGGAALMREHRASRIEPMPQGTVATASEKHDG